MAEPPAHQVKVVFTTTHDDLQLPETKRQLLVPADIKRYGLSRILNSSSMLATAAPIPLDFLVAGAFLRTSLAEYLAQQGLSAETTVTLTYVRSLLPPAFEAALPHEDWVSCVDVLSATSRAGAEWTSAEELAGRPLRERILSASYDGLVRVWDGGGRVLAASAAGVHSRRLNAARFLSAGTIVSAGADQKIVVWDYTEDAAGLVGRLRPALELVGHGHMVHSLDVKRDFDGTRRILSACADGSIGLWAASKRGAPPAAAAADLSGGPLPAKRAKLSASTPSAPQRGPLAMMTAVHSEPATAAVFDPVDPTRAYSVSHDHTLRTLDLETGRVVSMLSTLHPLICAACLPGGSSRLVAAGSSARHVSLLDTREATSAVAALTLRGHANMVSSVAAGPQAGGGGEGGHALVSGSHDGTCKVWDLRSVRPGRADEGGGSVAEPVFSIEREWLRSKGKRAATAGQGAKVLTVVWDGHWGIVSGGEDRTVQVDRGREYGIGG